MLYENEIYYQINNRDYIMPDNKGFEQRTQARWVVKEVRQKKRKVNDFVVAMVMFAALMLLHFTSSAQVRSDTIKVHSDTSKPKLQFSTGSTTQWVAGPSNAFQFRNTALLRFADSSGREVARLDSAGWKILDTPATIRVMQRYFEQHIKHR